MCYVHELQIYQDIDHIKVQKSNVFGSFWITDSDKLAVLRFIMRLRSYSVLHMDNFHDIHEKYFNINNNAMTI